MKNNIKTRENFSFSELLHTNLGPAIPNPKTIQIPHRIKKRKVFQLKESFFANAISSLYLQIKMITDYVSNYVILAFLFVYTIRVDKLPTFPGLIDCSSGFIHPVPPFAVVFNHLNLIDRNNKI